MRRHRYHGFRWFKGKIQCDWIPLLLGIVTTIAVLGLWQQLLVQEQLHIQQLVQQEATSIESELNRELSGRILALERMASRWQVSSGTPKALWEVDVANYIEHSYGYQAIEWVDPSFHVRWVVPLTGNEAAQNLDLSQEPRRRITLNVARDLRQTILTRAVSLAQGGKGFLAIVPLYVKDDSSLPGVTHFDGFIVGVFRFQPLFDSILEPLPQYQVQIFDRNGLIYSQGTPLPEVKPETRLVQAYGADWQVQVSPTSALIAHERSSLPNLVLGSGLLSSWALALVVYLGQQAKRQSRRTQIMNQQLQDQIIYRQESESTLRSFFNSEAMLMGIVELHEHDILHLSDNQTAANFFGTTPEAMCNRFASEIGVPQNHLQQWIQTYQEAERTQSPVHFEYPHETPSGQRWLAATVCQIVNHSNHHPRFSYIVEDITKRKQIELTLEKELLRSKTLLETSIDGIVTLNHQGNVVQTSSSFAQMIGYSIEETLRLNVSDWDAQWTKEELQNRLKGNSQIPPVFETRHCCKDGSFLDVEISYNRAELDGEIMHFCICRDISERKRVESAIAHLAAIIEFSEDAIISKSLEGIVTSWNAAAEKLFGYTAAEVIGQSIVVLIPDSLLDEEAVILEQIQSGQTIQSYDTQRRRKDGSLVDVSISISPIKNAEGRIVGASKIARDISERIQLEKQRLQSEQALRESEERFQAFMRYSPAVAWITDANGAFLYLNQKYLHTFRVPEDFVGKSIYDLFPSDVAQSLLESIQTVAHTQQALEAIEIAPRQDGSMGNFLVYKFPIPDIAGQTLVGGIAIDMTQQYQAEAALQESEERLQLALEASGDGLWDWNIATGEIYYSPQYMTMLGYEADELPHNFITWESLIHPDDKSWVLDTLNAHFKNSSRQYAFDYQVRTKSGAWKWIANYGKVVAYDAQDKPLRMIGMHRDISDRKQKETALRQAMEAAEAANLAKSMFLANMSHELRTPLNVILGFAQVMGHDSALTPAQLEDLQTIQRSGDHLLSLINDVLDLSKIEAGHRTLEESGFDLISLLHTLRTMMAERANAKQLQLTFEIAPEVPQFVIADEQKLRQVLLNLLSNAIKFTKQGSVTLRVTSWESSEKLCLVPNASQNDDSLNYLISSAACILQFEVTDTGVGIAVTEQAAIFDAFMQAKAGRTLVSGTGLGLTISRKLLELMDGSISVKSTPEVGSTFTVTVPVCLTSGVDRQVEPQDRAIIGLVPGQPHRRILVVDDQRENRMLMVRLLTRLGLEVQEAIDGQEAIALWQQWKPDLTWMDIRMPSLDGYEATKQIRAIEQEQASIIIALTAQASQSDRALALAAGCNDYISKPVREETLFLKLKEYLGLEYLYAEAEALPNSSSDPFLDTDENCQNSLDLATLAQLPADWLNTLEDLALCCNDQEIVNLAAQLPAAFEAFKVRLLDLANRFEFEKIIHLIHRDFSP